MLANLKTLGNPRDLELDLRTRPFEHAWLPGKQIPARRTSKPWPWRYRGFLQSFRIWVGNVSWSTESVANSSHSSPTTCRLCVCVCKENTIFLAVVLLLWVEMIRWHLSSLVRLITSCWYSKLPQQSLHQGPAFLHTDPQPMIRQFQVSYFCGILWYSAHNIHNCSFSRTSPWLSVNKILCASEGPEVGDVLSFSRDGDRNPVPPLWA